MTQRYDYIIAGAGASGLSLTWNLLQSPLAEKKILIVDLDLNPKSDKTWCFWDSGSPPFSDIVHKSWQQVEVSVFDNRSTHSLEEYTYHCLRSIDFQQKILRAANEHPNLDLLEEPITKLRSNGNGATLHTDNHSFTADYIFQSCFNPWDGSSGLPHYPLLQHFLGWEITLNKPLFSANTFTLMDFDETFDEGVAFMYLLPWSPSSGLIEYTVFSNQLLPKAFYEEKIELYLNNRFNLKPIDYQIQRREGGKIPMMDRPEKPWYKPQIMNIGTVGGITKASTGYTFRRIQRHAQQIVEGLLKNGKPADRPLSNKRFKAYDLWLLQIIHDHPKEALQVFNRLFRNNSMDEVFRFLGEETTFWQDLKIMNSVPYSPFLRAIWKTSNRLRII